MQENQTRFDDLQLHAKGVECKFSSLGEIIATLSSQIRSRVTSTQTKLQAQVNISANLEEEVHKLRLGHQQLNQDHHNSLQKISESEIRIQELTDQNLALSEAKFNLERAVRVRTEELEQHRNKLEQLGSTDENLKLLQQALQESETRFKTELEQHT